MNNLDDLHTIKDMIRWAISQFNQTNIFFGHGTESAWDEAFALVLHALHLPHDISPTILDANLTKQEINKIDKLIQQRVFQRIPLPYLTREAWFAGLSFYVDDRVLIPRSPMAELIENHFLPWINQNKINSILDLCTGSGCIAIACAYAFPDAKIDASDISETALTVAKINVNRHQVEHQVQLIQSDLFYQLPIKKYDLIISNPPYVDLQEMNSLPAEFLHEPQVALHAGINGLDYVINILKSAGDFLSPHGFLFVEVGNSEEALIQMFPTVDFTWLEFQRGGGGVFMLTAKQLTQFQHLFLAHHE